jgi:hypothetical protein
LGFIFAVITFGVPNTSNDGLLLCIG